MGVEVATWISDFVPANPASSDLRSQGDDHIRLEKQVLQNTFPSASKAFYFPVAVIKTANYSVLAADMNTTFYSNTSGGSFTYTLPTLVAGDAGWRCRFFKHTPDANPYFVAPPSGTIVSGSVSVAKARRAIPGVYCVAEWSGGAWLISRAVSLPLGALVPYSLAALPPGYEWPNGQTLASASTNYPDFYTANGSSGVVIDKRGRVGITLDNLGGAAAGRLAGGIITGTAVGNVGGADTVTLGLTQIPIGITSTNPAQSITVASTSTVPKDGFIDTIQSPGSGTPVLFERMTGGTQGTLSSSANNAISVTSTNTGGLSHSNLQPSIMVAEILVVE